MPAIVPDAVKPNDRAPSAAAALVGAVSSCPLSLLATSSQLCAASLVLVTQTLTDFRWNASGPNPSPSGTPPEMLNLSVLRSTTRRAVSGSGLLVPGTWTLRSPLIDRHTGLLPGVSSAMRASTEL